MDTVLADIVSQKEAPNREQRMLLESFVERLKVEYNEERSADGKLDSTPWFDILHGLPGTGKSRVIFWIRELMEKGLKWTHGVQFVCLAFQNSMAALINGQTIHHWSGIPTCTTAEGGQGFGDSHARSTKCQALRVLLIDELSMVSAELFGALEYVVKKAIRTRNTYKKRPDGSKRPFGGLNVLLCVDLWQIPPVGGTSFCSDPREVSPGTAHDAMNMLWGDGADFHSESMVLDTADAL